MFLCVFMCFHHRFDDPRFTGVPVTLISKDKKEFVVEKKAAMISTFIATPLVEDKEDIKELPVPGVNGNILGLVIKYMVEHKGVEPPIVEKPLRSKMMKDVCPYKW